jgi:hypothetical protein
MRTSRPLTEYALVDTELKYNINTKIHGMQMFSGLEEEMEHPYLWNW